MNGKDRYAAIEASRAQRAVEEARPVGKRCDVCTWRPAAFWAAAALLCTECAKSMGGLDLLKPYVP